MGEHKTYSGACHCGAVRFELTTSPLTRASTCNCSICARVGWVMVSVPATDFRLLSGEAAQRDYQFGAQRMHHLFCATCGVRSFATFTGANGEDMRLINLRCVDGIELKALQIQEFDGKSY